jgi:hypothetical protein
MYRSEYLLRVPPDKTTILSFGKQALVSSDGVSDPTAGGFRNEEGGQDPNLDPNDDDMSRLQDYDYDYPERDADDLERNRPERERNWSEEDYYSNLEYERTQDPGLVWPDRYSWDQFAPNW